MVSSMSPKRVFFIFFLILALGAVPFYSYAMTFVGEVKTGDLELADFAYPVYLFVPDNVQPGRKYPLIIAIPREGGDPKESLELWRSVAKRNTVLVLAPTFQPIDDTPYKWDRWFFQMKAVLTQMYPVNQKKIFLTGTDSGAHYAAYLGINYPDEFAAVALLGGSWVGKFEKLMRYRSDAPMQIPFYVALKEDQNDLMQAAEKRGLDLSRKGYMLQVMQFGKGEEYLNTKFKDELLKWMTEKSESWQEVVEKEQKTFKEKFKQGIKDFFVI